LFFLQYLIMFNDLHLEIDNEGQLKTKLYGKRDDFDFPIINFPFSCSNIPAAPAFRRYISKLIRYSRVCVYYHDFLDRGLLLTRKLFNQGFIMGKSSFRKFYGCHHNLVDCTEYLYHRYMYVPLVVATVMSSLPRL
jgi:hypothetical protein